MTKERFEELFDQILCAELARSGFRRKGRNLLLSRGELQLGLLRAGGKLAGPGGICQSVGGLAVAAVAVALHPSVDPYLGVTRGGSPLPSRRGNLVSRVQKVVVVHLSVNSLSSQFSDGPDGLYPSSRRRSIASFSERLMTSEK